jgi:hypothetical protein
MRDSHLQMRSVDSAYIPDLCAVGEGRREARRGWAGEAGCGAAVAEAGGAWGGAACVVGAAPVAGTSASGATTAELAPPPAASPLLSAGRSTGACLAAAQQLPTRSTSSPSGRNGSTISSGLYDLMAVAALGTQNTCERSAPTCMSSREEAGGSVCWGSPARGPGGGGREGGGGTSAQRRRPHAGVCWVLGQLSGWGTLTAEMAAK